MVLDLTRLFENEGEELPFSESLDLSDFEQAGYRPLQEPVSIEGKVSNIAGVVTVEYVIRYTTQAPCDRCLTPVVQKRTLRSSQVAVRQLSGEDNDEFLVLPDARLDLQELAYADIVLDLPSKNLCSEDCKGLCPICGANLNRELCSCERKSVDPRLQVLRDLLS